jgi:hypothetical protein
LETSTSKDFKIALWGNYTAKSYRYKPIDFGETQIQCDLPRNLMLQSTIMRVFWTANNDISNRFYCPDLVVGGIFEVELFSFPDMPKKQGSKHLSLMFRMGFEEYLLSRRHAEKNLLSRSIRRSCSWASCST